MNAIQQLEDTIRSKYPSAKMQMDTQPLRKDGVWFLDLSFNGQRIVIQWAADIGFGYSNLTSTPDQGYGSGPDEHFDTEEEVLRRFSVSQFY